MTSESREELISAYIDGELSPDERAQVERWLAESAELRQLHDELRALNSSVQALPRHKLEQDLGPAVVRRAERAVLAGSSDVPVAEKVGASNVGAGKVGTPSPLERWRSRGMWRLWAWPAVAIAAALLLLVFDNQRRSTEREVAQSPQEDVAIQAAPADNVKMKDALPRLAGGGEESGKEALEQKSGNYRFQPQAQGAVRLNESSAPVPAQTAAPSAVASPAPAPAGAPADAPDSLNLRMARPTTAAGEIRESIEALALQAADEESEERVAFEVPGEYIRQRDFEKLLDTNKLTWQRAQVVAAVKQRGPQDSSRVSDTFVPIAKDQAPPPTEPRVDYVVEATPEQVDEIVGELRNEKRGVNQIGEHVAGVRRAQLDRDTNQQQQRRVIFTLQTPLPQNAPPPPAEEKAEPK